MDELVAAADLTLVHAAVSLLHVPDEQVPLLALRHAVDGVAVVVDVNQLPDGQRVRIRRPPPDDLETRETKRLAVTAGTWCC